MSMISIAIPDLILQTHRHNLEAIQTGLQHGLVIWEYLNGQLSLTEAGQLLGIGYRGFLELLWSKGISIDGLSQANLELQVSQLRELLGPP